MKNLFWTLYTVNLAAVAAFGIAMVCLLRPRTALTAYRWTWERSAKLARTPAILDEAEARYVGLMFLLGAVILAGAALKTIWG